MAALQAQVEQLEKRLESKRGKKQAYKIAFAGKVLLPLSCHTLCHCLKVHANCMRIMHGHPHEMP